jgi:hypothetical protein
MRRRIAVTVSALIAALLFAAAAPAAETNLQYENRFRIMLDFAVRINEYTRLHLQDTRLCAWAHAVALANASEAEQMSPPEVYATLHPHFLLVLENVERCMYYAARRNMDRYRHHQKIVRQELGILETLSERAGIESFETFN